ncbi:TetR/AcrR family transcriptional regulator [Umezawaea endophytica]|uniref:TetR/AcrR family transcriptional regulator n=1 Tax=Umezawaea endophytica TaxID=1654476 RepID=A0A9X2VVM8_9PSEU|nr:TetR/AcrR family transcriptional regulator [Umezawaea endophytica]MCS7483529.1 TetR/AcrR family transcriptional regulator [Umezawaea endophytica]
MVSAPVDKTTKKHIDADTRRRMLVAAALRVMKREGIAAATTRAICAEAGMPHGAFHYCFRSKQELYAALLATDINITLDVEWPAVDPRAEPVENLRTLLRSWWSAVETDPEAQLVLSELVNLALRDPELGELPAWGHRTYLDKAVSRVDHFAAEARLHLTIDTRAFAEMVVAALGGVIDSWLSHRDATTAVETLDGFAGLFATLTRPVPDDRDHPPG